MTPIERIKSYTKCTDYLSCDECPLFCSDNDEVWCRDYVASLAKTAIEELEQGTKIEELETDSKLQEQYVTKLESDNEKLRKIVNILCDTISQLIE